MEIPFRMMPALSQPSVLFAVEARRMLDEGRVRQAIETCKRGLARFPEHVAGYIVLSAAYRRLGDHRRADLVLRRGYQRTGLPALGTAESTGHTDQPTSVAVHAAHEPAPMESETSDRTVGSAAPMDPMAVEPKSIDPQAIESGTFGRELIETQAIETEKIEPEANEQPTIEPQTIESGMIARETIQTEAIESRVTETETIDTAATETEAIEPQSIEPEALETGTMAREAVEPEAIEPRVIENEEIESETIETETIEPEAIETEAIETEPTGTETAKLETQAMETASHDMQTREASTAHETSGTWAPREAEPSADPATATSEMTSVEPSGRASQGERRATTQLHIAGMRTTPAWFSRRPAGNDPSRPSALALHSAKGAHRMRSANLRLIPGLEFAPLRHEEPNGRTLFVAPNLDESLPEWNVRRSGSKSQESVPLPDYPQQRQDVGERPGHQSTDTEGLRRSAEEPVGASPEPQASTPDLDELAKRLEGARIKPVGEVTLPHRAGFEPPIVSDTLAEILVSQGAYSEALKAFQTLARMRPERLPWYEQRIAEMKKLIADGGSISRL